ncbi:MAG: hypothetical protein IJ272_09780 [Clostridia bacterium]|nr:hypothetical protein [Clostridia bacterium]
MAVLAFFGMVLIFLIPSAIVALIVTAAINKEKGNDVTKFSIGVKTVYTYIIVIATLFMIVSGTIVAVSSLLDYFLPESEFESEYNCTDYYSSSYCNTVTQETRIQNEKNAGITEFASSLALVLVVTPLFVTHSKEAKKLRDEKVKEK